MKSEDFRAGKRYITDNGNIYQFIEAAAESRSTGWFSDHNGLGMHCMEYSFFSRSVSDAKAAESKPEFEVDELIEVSDNPAFDRARSGYFICDARNSSGFSGGCPFVIVSTMTGSVLSFSYARKLQKYTIKYDCVPVEVSKEEFDQYEAQRKRVQAAAKGGDS